MQLEGDNEKLRVSSQSMQKEISLLYEQQSEASLGRIEEMNTVGFR
jgi:hypothetical protein